ncbi:ABC transporter permease [Rhabdaerophilum sp. SD176]|uniref:ABC transporter permease n=1 Tax=Rhabdaerophilum sp. SD176 TaxID=2983548 RepID=UPI0024DF5883|nr:ABC transporter permease [Rhabdaerophilum sp. SD176]
MIDWALIAESWPLYLNGLKISLILMAISVSASFLLSVPLAIARVSRNPWLSKPVFLYTYVIRGTPLLVQLYMIYFGLAQFEWLRESMAWPLFRNAWFCAWLAFALNSTAYTTEILAGALRQTPSGELEAARSLGMSTATIYTRILLPSAIRRALPQYGNELVMVMHATSIASAVTIVELTRTARDVYYNHLAPFEAFGLVAVFYFVITFALVGLVKLLEGRFLRHLRPMSIPSKAA